MRELRGFVELFDKNDVKNLFDALSSCIEYVRMELYIFDSHVQQFLFRALPHISTYSHFPPIYSPMHTTFT